MCLHEANESYIENVLAETTSTVYDQLVTYLSLHDIHLLISTLECLYSLSCLGEATCNSIVRTQGAVEALVSLVTVEAQSYGPKACILMRVVETVPGASQNAAAGGGQQQVHQLQPAQPQLMQQQQVQPQTVQPGQIQVVASAGGVPQTQTVSIAGNSTTVRTVAPAIVNQGGNIVRGQLVSIARPPGPPGTPQIVGGATAIPIGGQQITGQVVTSQGGAVQLHIPNNAVPFNRPQLGPQGGQRPQQQIVMTTVNGQTQQLIITTGQPTNVTTANTPVVVQQPQQPQQQSQLQSQPQQIQQQVRPPAPQQVQASPAQAQPSQAQAPRPVQPQTQQQQPIQQPSQQPQQPQQTQVPPQQPGSQQQPQQQVQLRVCNDEGNRQFCLSWLKATYESVNSNSIEQQVMYKQYLASLHKLGKRDVISAQHYAVCVRYEYA